MAFLAALALGASLVADRAALGWQSGLSDRMTIQIMPPEQGDARAQLDSETKAAVSLLDSTPGIAHAHLLSDAEINALVEPWIGKDGVVAGIPLAPPDRRRGGTPGAQVDTTQLAAQLKRAAPHASLDDHRRWIGRLKGLADAVRWSAYGILLLIAGATAAAVSFATRAGLDAHHEMVELLHQMGALPAFIARAVEWHYFVSALFAAALGTLFAGLFFAGAAGWKCSGWRRFPSCRPCRCAGPKCRGSPPCPPPPR